MMKETVTEFTQYLEEHGVKDKTLSITVRHDLSYECSYRIQIGCQDVYVTAKDFDRITRTFSAARRLYKSLEKAEE